VRDAAANANLCAGHFVLTHLLLDDLKKAASAEDGDARVVVVSSSLHDVECSKKRGRKFIILLVITKTDN